MWCRSLDGKHETIALVSLTTRCVQTERCHKWILMHFVLCLHSMNPRVYKSCKPICEILYCYCMYSLNKSILSLHLWLYPDIWLHQNVKWQLFWQMRPLLRLKCTLRFTILHRGVNQIKCKLFCTTMSKIERIFG